MVAPRNRHAPLLPPSPAPAVPPKDDLKGRYQFVSDAVLKAVAAVTRLLDDDDPDVVMKAAKMILDLEKTRMRHGQQVHGVYKPDYLDVLQELGPLPADRHRLRAEVAEEVDDEDEEEDDDLLPVARVVPAAPAPEPASAEATPARGPVPQEESHAPSPFSQRGPAGESFAPSDEPSEFRRCLRQDAAARLARVPAPQPGDCRDS